MSRERLQKIIANAGLASRRTAEEWIRQGKVTVNGEVAGLGSKADPDRDAILIDGKLMADANDAMRYISTQVPGSSIQLEGFRKGKPISLQARVSERPTGQTR